MDNQKMNNNRPDQDPEGGNNKKDDMNKKSLLVMVVLAIAVMIIAQMLSGKIASASQKEVTYTEFMQDVKDGKVTKVELDSDRIYYEVKNQKNVKYYTGNVQDERLYEELDNAGVTYSRKVIDTTTYVMSSILSFVLPTVLMVAVMMIFYRFAFKGGGGVMGVGKSNAKLYVQDKTGVTFQDVAGQEESKESLREIVDFLHNPEKYTKIGAKLPKGALLVGPPGTGKTLLAKAVAGEAGVPFFSISGSDFVEMFVGVGASRVRDLFENAKKNAPCIVFIDEIDAVARKRGTGLGGGHDEREQTLNQLLVEMDGFGVNEGIIVMAATNRVDILDPAILRPGRFDRKVGVGRPDIQGRREILEVHAKGKPLGDDVDLDQIARTTAGFTGADLENLMNEAAIYAAKQSRAYIVQDDIRRAFVKVGIGAEKKSRVISDKEKKITAYHESGHALLFHLLPDVGPVYSVSIIPTGIGAAGYTMPLPERDNMFNTKGKMMQDIVVSLGGRVAEELIFDDITTGASQDIKTATETARAMVTEYGMSDAVGLINYTSGSDEVFIGRDIGHSKPYGEGIAAVIDQEVKRIVDGCHQEARRIITEHLDELQACANLLIDKEKITREEFEAIFPEKTETEKLRFM